VNIRPDAVQDDRPVFVVKFRPEPDVDPIRALRWILKITLRQFGMKCLDIRIEETSAGPAGAKP
jgi:hypothetical protein